MKFPIVLGMAGCCLAAQLYSCKQKENEPSCPAGSGGSIALILEPQHHGKEVRPYKAYLRFNALDAPSSLNAFDLKVDADTTQKTIRIPNLKCGSYYIYATAYDTAVKAAVKGGIPYQIPQNTSAETRLVIPVTE